MFFLCTAKVIPFDHQGSAFIFPIMANGLNQKASLTASTCQPKLCSTGMCSKSHFAAVLRLAIKPVSLCCAQITQATGATAAETLPRFMGGRPGGQRRTVKCFLRAISGIKRKAARLVQVRCQPPFPR